MEELYQCEKCKKIFVNACECIDHEAHCEGE